jgi:hypothetical protein
MVNEECEFKDTREVEAQSEDHGGVKRPNGITEVWKATIVIVSEGIAFDLNAGESDVEDTFNNDKYPVKGPCA